MADNQEFLSAHQCFIVFDSLSRKIAISIRNRLSREGIKCTIWDEKHFEDNEYRLSNFNRVLFLSAKYADEYLSNPEIKEEISDFVIYRREGRTASLTLVDSKVKFDDVYKELETRYKEFITKGESISDKEKAVLEKLTPEDVEESLKLVPVNNVPLLPAPKEAVVEQKPSIKEAAKIVAKYGGSYLLSCALGGFPLATSAVVASLITYGIKSATDSKRVLLFAGALVFEKDYINDFVNAE